MAGYDQPCRVRGHACAPAAASSAIDALGQRGHAWGDPDWDRIELARTSARGRTRAGAALTAVRPAGARHHAEEAVWAALWEPEGSLAARGRPPLHHLRRRRPHAPRRARAVAGRRARTGPRRGAGEVLCGSSLDLGALRLDCAFFRWHLEGRAGVGRYDILRRAAAA